MCDWRMLWHGWDPPNEVQRQSSPVEPRFIAPAPLQAAHPAPASNKPVVEPQMRAAINEVANDQTDIDYLPAQELRAAPEPVAVAADPTPGGT